MLDVHVVSAPAQRHGPRCLNCGLLTTITRVTPHPSKEARALLCSYECTCCGKTVNRQEF